MYNDIYSYLYDKDIISPIYVLKSTTPVLHPIFKLETRLSTLNVSSLKKKQFFSMKTLYRPCRITG